MRKLILGLLFAAAITNPGQIWYTANSGTQRKLSDKLSDAVSVIDFGAKCDGFTDDATAINAGSTAAAGRTLEFPTNGTCIVGASINLQSGTTYRGRAIIKGKPSGWTPGLQSTNGALFLGTGVTGVTFKDLEINANYDNGGAYYGVYFTGGTYNTVANSYIHDTGQACIVGDTESHFRAVDSRLINCGRNYGTNDHGIMVGSNTSAITDIVISRLYVEAAHRKGITLYANNTGTQGSYSNAVISESVAVNCGLSNIFLGGGSGGTDLIVNSNVWVTNNVTRSDAAGPWGAGSSNINITGALGGGLIGNTATYVTPGSESQSIQIDTVQNFIVANNITDNTNGHGINFGNAAGAGNSTQVTITGNTITRSNKGLIASGSGLRLTNVSFSYVAENQISDSGGNQVYALNEDTGSNNNIIGLNYLRNATTALINITGAATVQAGAQNAAGNNVWTNGLVAPQFFSAAANPASTGTIRLATGDQIFWRNNANSADVGISKNASDNFNFSSSIIAPVFFSATANPAASGIIRLASADQIFWRNNANSGDVGINKNASDNFNFSNGIVAPQFFSSTANIASAGQLRLASTDAIDFRNNANGANLALAHDTSDRLTWAGSGVRADHYEATGTTGAGTITLTSATPSTGTATVFSGARCVCTNQTTQANPIKCSVSATTLTATGPNTVTDVVTYLCF